jgi:hypothetical protein
LLNVLYLLLFRLAFAYFGPILLGDKGKEESLALAIGAMK